MPQIEIHEHESNIDESFLLEKRKDFESDAKFLLDLLYRGWRLNGRQVEMWGINSRRLRELVISHKEIKKEWKLNSEGKREVMEYFLSIPQLPTKKQLTEKVHESNSKTPVIAINRNEYIQKDLFK